MKRLLFAICLFTSIIAKAQFEKGEKFIGGTIGLGFSTSSNNQNNSLSTSSQNNFGINLNPQFFKAANSNTLRGFTFGLGFSNSNGSQNQTTNGSKNINNGFSASIGYAIRKYKPFSEKLFWYMEYSANVGYSYSSQKITYTNPNTTMKFDGRGYNATIVVLPALAYKVDNRLLIDVNFGGLSTGYNYSSSEGIHSHNYVVQLNFTSRLSLGILWKLKNSNHSHL